MNSIFKNSFFNFLSQALIFASSLVLSVLLARYLGTAGLGEYSYLLWLATSIAFISTLGLPNALTRYVSQYIAENKLSEMKVLITFSLAFGLAISIIISTFFIIVLSLLNLENIIFYYLVALTIPVLILNNIMSGFIQGLQKYGLLLRINLFITPLNFVFTVSILFWISGELARRDTLSALLQGSSFFGQYIQALLTLNLLIALTSFFVFIYNIKEYLSFKIRKLPASSYKEIFKYTSSISLIYLIDVVLMERSEIFFLKIFSSIEQVGFYSLAFNFVNKTMVLLPGAVVGVLVPSIATFHGKKDMESIKSLYYSTSRYLVLITFPLIFGGFVTIDLLTKVFLGEQYLPIVPVVKILLISGGLSVIAGVAASVLYGIGKQNFILKIGIVAVTINLALDLYLIPQFGAIGAAFANSIAQIVGVVMGIYYVVVVRKMPFPYSSSVKVFASALFAAIIVLVLKQMIILPVLFALIIFSLVFVVSFVSLLVVIGFFNAKDIEAFKKTYRFLPFLK